MGVKKDSVKKPAKSSPSAKKKSAGSSAKNSKKEKISITLPEVMDISTAESILEQLKKAGDISLDASKVEKITTPGVQLIISADLSMQNNKGSFSIENPSDIFTSSLNNLGFSEKLKEWEK
ncbi:STAS domain-containing protein [Rickettsiales bacterium]|nr:STAS domain-containing protein [Rickettsiales bacterium]